MKTKIVSSALLMILVLAVWPAGASTITYSFDVATSNGQNITNVMIFESAPGMAQPYIDWGENSGGYTIDGTGFSQLSHTSAFAPSTSLILGLTQGVEKTQIVMFVNGEFAADATGLPFSSSFTTTSHSGLITHILGAQSGSQSELDWFMNVFFPGDGVNAAFATGGSLTAMEFSGGVVIGDGGSAVPEHSETSLLLGLGLGLLIVARRLSVTVRAPNQAA